MLKKYLIISSLFIITFSVSIPSNAIQNPGKVGVLFGSFGDIDEPEELKDFIINTLEDPDVLPLPKFFRFIISRLSYHSTKNDYIKKYQTFGFKSNMRLNSQIQADIVAQNLRHEGYDAEGYYGFTMTFPYLDETLEQARLDEIETLIVFNQGAQYSQVTTYTIFRDVKEYLLLHPEWDVNVIGVKSFSDDNRFRDLIVERIDNKMEIDFPEIPEQEICIFLPMHGNIMKWKKKGDPSYDQKIRIVKYIQNWFSKSYVGYGFQNHDDLPFLKWSEPKDTDALEILAQQQCPYVISNGMITYTIDNMETLYEHEIEEKEIFYNFADQYGLDKEFVVEGQFNDDPKFAKLMADLAIEAINGQGDLFNISEGDLQSISYK